LHGARARREVYYTLAANRGIVTSGMHGEPIGSIEVQAAAPFGTAI
jgi:hypothetical protein